MAHTDDRVSSSQQRSSNDIIVDVEVVRKDAAHTDDLVSSSQQRSSNGLIVDVEGVSGTVEKTVVDAATGEEEVIDVHIEHLAPMVIKLDTAAC